MLKNATIFISGGAGFIGTQLVKRLVDYNKIIILDILRRDAITRTSLLNHPNVTLVKGDVRHLDTVKKAMKTATHIIHLASVAGVDTVIGNPLLTMDITIKGTFNMLEAATEHGNIQRFIDLSTSEVFGSYAYKVNEGDVTSLGTVGEARWTYAVSKLATEHLCHVMHKQKKLPIVTIRPFNIFGPGQVGEGAIHHFIVNALKNQNLTVHNDGSQIRAWCYVDDFLNGLITTLTHENAIGKTFNIGNPQTALTVYNLAALIIRLVNPDLTIKQVEWPYPDVELRIPDISRARELLGFRPEVNLEEGIIRTVNWYKDNL
jgi:nucleoside-diphosphate-sugar epimerase